MKFILLHVFLARIFFLVIDPHIIDCPLRFPLSLTFTWLSIQYVDPKMTFNRKITQISSKFSEIDQSPKFQRNWVKIVDFFERFIFLDPHTVGICMPKNFTFM